MPLPQATQARVDRLQASWRVIEVEFQRNRRWRQWAAVEALATALKLIDACICAEEGAEPFAAAADARIVARLREIARDRNLFAGETLEGDTLPAPAPAESETIEGETAGESTE